VHPVVLRRGAVIFLLLLLLLILFLPRVYGRDTKSCRCNRRRWASSVVLRGTFLKDKKTRLAPSAEASDCDRKLAGSRVFPDLFRCTCRRTAALDATRVFPRICPLERHCPPTITSVHDVRIAFARVRRTIIIIIIIIITTYLYIKLTSML